MHQECTKKTASPHFLEPDLDNFAELTLGDERDWLTRRIASEHGTTGACKWRRKTGNYVLFTGERASLHPIEPLGLRR